MSPAIASIALGPAASDRPAFPLLSLHYLRRSLEQRRQRRLDRVVAEMVLELDHEGIVEDYRAACRRW
ncbi:MAG TPA: hypothetical protein VMU81_22040 [Acetobacteraceae bacterium]|jgi:hypothetical protein|nr:hypothetical protein [Acetobacteraceae bacterium]